MIHSDYGECRLCPRDCGAARAAGRPGVCGETAALRIASIGPHFGEEPCFTGTHGSGTIFFSGCPSRCFFCQNHQISTGRLGEELDDDALFARALELAERGVHNINFVTPDHFWPHVERLCARLREAGVAVPFLFNGSGYHRPEMVARYAGPIDIFLPDFKFADGDLARLCMGDARYPELALAALRAMVEARGFLDPWDPTGATTARRGVLVRHLVMPGETENSLEVLRLLRREFGRLLPIAVMSQFKPVPACGERQRFTRGLTADEYDQVRELVDDCGFEHVFVQELREDDAFFPDFKREQPFAGNEGRD